jgi:ferredoxin
MKITVDVDLCRGHQACEDVAPEIFGVNEDGIVVLLNDSPDESFRKHVMQAARLCPERVITVTD